MSASSATTSAFARSLPSRARSESPAPLGPLASRVTTVRWVLWAPWAVRPLRLPGHARPGWPPGAQGRPRSDGLPRRAWSLNPGLPGSHGSYGSHRSDGSPGPRRPEGHQRSHGSHRSFRPGGSPGSLGMGAGGSAGSNGPTGVAGVSGVNGPPGPPGSAGLGSLGGCCAWELSLREGQVRGRGALWRAHVGHLSNVRGLGCKVCCSKCGAVA
ncbi:hypothetical protein T484DRAFT_2312141 [Baffinella frigidus]|nr:hypothetical protein T484DRAFT_2312141 [Cryptophyta sp. CCMP2293]